MPADAKPGLGEQTRCTPPLGATQVQDLWSISAGAAGFADGRRCLAEHFRISRNPAEERRALVDLYNNRASRYDPAVLLSLAVLELNAKHADTALQYVLEAERFQNKLAGADLYAQLALIQEVKGNAYRLRFNATRSPTDLDRALSSWLQYQSLARDHRDGRGEEKAATTLRSLELLKRHEEARGGAP